MQKIPEAPKIEDLEGAKFRMKLAKQYVEGMQQSKQAKKILLNADKDSSDAEGE